MAEPADALVVDASVAAKWHLTDEEAAEQALVLLERFAAGAVRLVAPDQIRYEVPSAITVATLGRNARLTYAQGRQAIEKFLALALPTVSDDELIVAAYPLVHQHGVALYDALYVALAQRLAIPFITGDGKLYRLIRSLPKVLWIGDYPQEPSDDDQA